MSRWGRYWPGFVEVAAWDRSRLFEAHTFVPLPELDCYPLPALHRTGRRRSGRWPAGPATTPARTPGEGMEFAGVREYVPGDRQRSINWAATTRRGRLQVNTFAAERSEDLRAHRGRHVRRGRTGARPRSTTPCGGRWGQPAPTLTPGTGWAWFFSANACDGSPLEWVTGSSSGCSTLYGGTVWVVIRQRHNPAPPGRSSHRGRR